jgi:3-oxoacyl-[acyl-carrier-protein] synthase III
MKAAIQAIEYYLPERTLTTEQLAAEQPEWRVPKIDSNTGIAERHIAAEDEYSSDLAVKAAQVLFRSGACQSADIDFILLCTQTPDYYVPTTACLIQDRLGIPSTAGALDFNLGSSGYVYGLGLAQGLIESGQARRVLLLTAETYTKFVHPRDRNVRTIFGDAATATCLGAVDSETAFLGPYIYGTDGSGGNNMIVPAGGMRTPRSAATAEETKDESGNIRSQNNILMNGGEIFSFTLTVVPKTVAELLTRSGLQLEDIDLFVFHQANRQMLEHLRKGLKIPADKFYLAIRHGNTACNSIPVALKQAHSEGRVQPGARVMLVGFGPGYSWGATLVRWVG